MKIVFFLAFIGICVGAWYRVGEEIKARQTRSK